MGLKFSNNASTTVDLICQAGDSSVRVVDQSKFPTLASGDYFYATLSDPSNTSWEIVKITGTSNNHFVIGTRGLEGTAAQAWVHGSILSLRMTTGMLEELMASKEDAGASTAMAIALG